MRTDISIRCIPGRPSSGLYLDYGRNNRMIQDIAPGRLDNRYIPRAPGPGDRILLFDPSGRMHAVIRDGQLCFPSEAEAPAAGAVYLFSVDNAGYFLAAEDRGSGCIRSGSCGIWAGAGNCLRPSPPGISGNGIGTTSSAAGAAAATDSIPRKEPCNALPAGRSSIPASIRPSSSASSGATAC